MKNMNYIVISVVGFSLIFNAVLVSSQSLAIDCGAKGGKDEDGRTWVEDSKYLASSGDSVQVQAGYQDPSLLSTVPYMNARIIKSPATYKFSIKSKQRYLLRFHFYPSTYANFNVSNSYFAVTAGDLKLMNNFSAAITCQALTQAYIVKEYSLAPSDSESLEITFTPSANYSNTFAFINGIELIAMPDLFGMMSLIGYGNDINGGNVIDASLENMELMFRLNVGGQTIPPGKDVSGLLRSWFYDEPYIFGASIGVTNQAAKDVRIDYRNVLTASAPEDVYRTSRSMGRDNKMNLMHNLTWVFHVDPNFTYMVRLHFCEFQFEKDNMRASKFYINNDTTQSEGLDVIALAKGKGVPLIIDYGIAVTNDSIKLEGVPSTESKPQFYDAFLNGLEIFKLNDGTKSFAGKNPEPSEMMLQTENEARSFSEPKTDYVVVGATGGVAAAFVAVALLLFFYTKKRTVHGVETHSSSWLPVYGNSSVGGSKSNSNNLATLAQGLSRHFSISEIKKATKNFDESNVIGVGGFGKVYKGVVDGGTSVAIKRSNPSSEQGVNEFQTEIEMLSKLRHKHLVSLIGFCEDGGEMCLVYDYMARGTFREHIYNNKKPNSNLSWKQRLEICIGAARGLHYLHTGAKYTIIHRDVKTTNILLDEKWVAKVSDFGLSKTGPDLNQGHVSTVVKGSFGYLDPEYFRRQQLTEKSDVYSFGVVLFEALCSRPPLNPSLPKEQVSLADWALRCCSQGTLESIIDPNLKGKIDPECLKKFTETAVKCLSDQGIDRPHMGDVLWNLEFALQLQETADNTKGGSSRGSEQGSVHSRDDSSVGHRREPSGHSLGNEVELNEGKDESAIFTQLANPAGR
ncbi:Receptor-like protein kinase FERONIA [Hibiscus syriacus]|uniref:non-specific serine/threonine protein kinase n=1 Tax=Hibiscus syriacus TaxID=106335 RepID=A0A6A2YG18_HIBSY|nr:receptor-like protein kinase ANXUR1 [Hibiscus syriacus]KAE8678576.1 Receptor-like protein kinase FERONIA [Hibiscus syriacus]